MILVDQPKWKHSESLTSTELQFLMCDKYWFQYANIIGLFLLTISIILIGVFLLNMAKHVKYLNLLCAMYLIFYFVLSTDIQNSWTLQFNLNSSPFVNLFIFITTLVVLIFYFSISDVFYIQENTKIEFSLLVLFIYISSIFLISNKDFISIIILLECIAFSSYVLIGFERNNKFSTTSALQYLILASVPSGFFILGVSLLYHNYGSFVQDYLLLLLKDLNNVDLLSGIATNGLQLCWKEINTYYLINGISYFEWYTRADLAYINYLSFNFENLLKTHWIQLNEVFSIFNPSLLMELSSLEAFFMENAEIFEVSKKTLVANLSVDKFRLTSQVSPEMVELFKFYKWLSKQQLFVNEQFIKMYLAWPINGIENVCEEKCFKAFNNSEFVNKESVIQYFAMREEFSHIFSWFQMMAVSDYWRELDVYLENSPEGFDAQGIYKSILGWFGINEFHTILVDQLERLYMDTTDFWTLWISQQTNCIAMWKYLNIDYDLTYYSIRETYKQFLWSEYFSAASNVYSNQYQNLTASQWKGLSYTISDLCNSPNFNPITKNWKFLDGVIGKDIYLYTFLNKYFNEDVIKNYYNLYTTIYSNQAYFSTGLISIYLVLLFILINLGFKLTAAPFHLWAPSVYGGAPLAALTFLSIFSKVTIIFFSIWLFIHVFDSLTDIWQPFCLIMAFLSIISSILGAFTEKMFKRFFVYSSMGHVGFMLIGISVLNIDGLKSTFDYLVIYIISSFIIWFIIMHLTKKTTMLVNLKGLSLNQPFLGLIFSITIFSLSGIPPMGGFFVKYEIFYSLIHSSLFYFAYILLLLTVVSFFYYLRLIKIVFFENNKIYVKNKNLNDIKLRIISYLFFLIPFYMLFIDNPLALLIKNIFRNSL
jgi:NADH:ubiquinone oxidoreductase subunit 2 (subunit N)